MINIAEEAKGTGASPRNFWVEEDKSYFKGHSTGSFVLCDNASTIKTEFDATKATEGLRYNEGKPRYDLLPPHPINQLVKLLTNGAKKYADRNWEKGMNWTKVLASLKRHLASFELGEDYDEETAVLHMTNVMWNAMALVQYYKTHPEYDDRALPYKSAPKIAMHLFFHAIDIDTLPFEASTVESHESLKASNFTWVITDNYQNFVSLNEQKYCAFLLTHITNQRYNVGYRRIDDFNDFKQRFL